MIKTSIIKKYLKEFLKNYLTFDIKYTKKETEYLLNFNITTESTFDHYGNINNLDDKKLNDFLTNIGINDNINILNKIIHKLAGKVTSSYETNFCWLTIRITLPHHYFDIPRWHKDGNFFRDSNRIQSKFVTVLKGPGTLFIKKSKKIDEIYNKNNEEEFESYKKLKVKTMFNEKIENKYRKILANKFKNIKHNQLKSNQGLIFLVGPDKNNNLHGLMHSEPTNDAPRIFISILPGSEIEIMELQKRWSS